MIDPDNDEIADDLHRLGVRRRPPLNFLPRGHLANRWLGILRERLGLQRAEPSLTQI